MNMKTKLLPVVLAAMVSLALSLPAWGQTTATVHGTAKDEQGKPIEGAVVILFNTDNARTYTLKTDKKGQYSAIGVAPGTYRATLKKDNVELWVAEGVPILLAKDINIVDFDLAKLWAEARKSGSLQMSEEQKKQME